MFTAGAAEVDITPPAGTWLIGCEGPSTGVHDPLMAHTLVLESGADRFAFVSLDLCGLAREDSATLREAVAQAAGTDARHVLLLLTHNHSAPFSIPWSVTGWGRFRADDSAWLSGSWQRISETAARAAAHMAPVRLSFSRAAVQVGMNRRLSRPQPDAEAVMEPNPDGAAVPWSDVIQVTGADSAPLAVLFSHAAHPVMIHWASTLISADYPGYAGRRIRERLGSGVMPLFAMGCGADSNAPWATGFERCQQTGIDLGDAVAEACARAGAVDPPLTWFETSRLDLPLKPFEAEERLAGAIAQEQLAAQQSEKHFAQEAVLVRQDKLRVLREGRAPASMPYDISVLAFGQQLAVVALPHEVFAGYQLAIDRLSPFRNTVVWAYCNVTENYIPTDAEHSRGGYEITGGPLEYRYRTGPATGAEALIVGRTAEMLARAYRAA